MRGALSEDIHTYYIALQRIKFLHHQTMRKKETNLYIYSAICIWIYGAMWWKVHKALNLLLLEGALQLLGWPWFWIFFASGETFWWYTNVPFLFLKYSEMMNCQNSTVKNANGSDYSPPSWSVSATWHRRPYPQSPQDYENIFWKASCHWRLMFW